jgi:hypothetical protein
MSGQHNVVFVPLTFRLNSAGIFTYIPEKFINRLKKQLGENTAKPILNNAFRQGTQIMEQPLIKRYTVNEYASNDENDENVANLGLRRMSQNYFRKHGATHRKFKTNTSGIVRKQMRNNAKKSGSLHILNEKKLYNNLYRNIVYDPNNLRLPLAVSVRVPKGKRKQNDRD